MTSRASLNEHGRGRLEQLTAAGHPVAAWWRRVRRRQPVILKPYAPQYAAIDRFVRSSLTGLLIAGFCLIYGFAFALFAPWLMLPLVTPLAVLGGLVIWTLPDSKRAPTGVLERLFFAFLVALFLWPNYLAITLPGLPWITMIRLTGFPMLFIFLVCISSSSAVREDLGQHAGGAPWILRLLVCFAITQALSIAMSSERSMSIEKFVLAQIYWTAVFFISAYVFSKPGRPEKFAYVMWALAIPIGLIAIIEYTKRRVLWADHIPSFLKIDDENVLSILDGGSRTGTDIYRAQGPFSTALTLAEFFTLAVPYIVHFAVVSKKTWLRIAAFVSLPFLFLAIMRSGARLGMVGFFMSLLSYLLFWGATKWRNSRTSGLGPAVVISFPAIGGGFLAATFLIGRLRAMVWGSGATQYSSQARLIQYDMGIPKVIARPFGYGIGRGAETLGYFAGDKLTIDTYYMAVALEYGVLGFIFYYGMIIAGIAYAAHTALMRPSDGDRDMGMLMPTAIALTNFLIIKSIFSQQDNHPAIFMMLGMVCALIYRSKAAPRP